MKGDKNAKKKNQGTYLLAGRRRLGPEAAAIIFRGAATVTAVFPTPAQAASKHSN
ncbi:MAG: hypothetical protein ACYC6Q_05440 [Syntrophales bacterium]